MVVSFHPCFEADTNIICAGRDPDANDRAAIRAAHAVVLPQGCREPLYRMASDYCENVFPDYAARFRYPGKTGQARLLAELATPHPKTRVFENTAQFKTDSQWGQDLARPLVFKLDWGGEGDTVALIRTSADLDAALARAAAFEHSGQTGFVLQEYVPESKRTLRVVVIGRYMQAYWRVQDAPHTFGTSVSHGARIVKDADPELQQAGLNLAADVCRRTGINLAGMDMIFAPFEGGDAPPTPLLLEINYFFGRSGIGGSEVFYGILQTEIQGWLDSL
jgi:ribosomal protein S6--L-glutamate ligase